MDRLYNYILIMFAVTLIELLGVFGLFLAYSPIYILIIFIGIIAFNFGYSESFNFNEYQIVLDI